MKRGTFNHIKEILLDYPKTDEYVKKREKELRYPHRERDENSGIKGSRVDNDPHINLMITIEKDKRLTALERNKKAVEQALENADDDTATIIRELYFKKRPNYTMNGLIANKLIYVGRTKATELRDDFFEEVAKELELTW